MGDYGEACRSFSWKEIEKRFSWYQTGKVNIAYEAIDRHAEDPVHRDRCCLNFEGEARSISISYGQMKELSNRFANTLRKLGVIKGDRVLIFLPRCPEYYVAILGCAKIGAVCGPLFEALMQATLKERLLDSGAKVLVTSPRMMTRLPVADLPDLKHIILVGAGRSRLRPGEWNWETEMSQASSDCDLEWVRLEDPLYLIYIDDSTGKPKGIVHSHRDMVGQWVTAKWVLDLKEGDVLWTTADPGWVTGTVYGAFAPWLCGAESFVRYGIFDLEGWCRSIESHRISVWYSAPTVFRRLMARGELVLKRYDMSSLRHLVSVGEPLPPEVVYWARRVFKTPIHDTWWMTETGMILIANYPGMPIKPGSIGKPFPGTKVTVLGVEGEEAPPLTLGELAIQKGWPAMMTQVWRDEVRFREYFRDDSWFITGDMVYADDDGYFYYQGRSDDLIKVAGVVIGPSELEDLLRKHPSVADAGILGKSDPLKGNTIKAFVALKPGVTATEALKGEIIQFVRSHFSPRIVPDEIEFRPKIPRTKEGEVIRRTLKAWELGLPA
ncbi:MAG: acetate--CoA ligase [Deltaproteobacteria bacterium RBG_13_53_10]|nr:MAG: acetate--CoA ligase [Deltaproteobacteria bacterium RBG_13_53_10]